MKHAFLDAATGRLKAHGYVESNQSGDIRLDVADDFDLDPRDGWRWTGATWVAFIAPPSALAQALDDVLADVTPTGPKLRAVLAALRKVTR